ncbi:MAG: divergent PAP2 family protein [Patescibacteria group bacterium]
MSGAALVLSITALTWLIAQTTKYLVGSAHHRRRKFLDTGGMPSVHAAVIVGVTTAIALEYGTDDPAFALGVIVSIIVMHDAVRVRWPLGETAIRVNELARRSKLPTVAVFRGHRTREVLAGAAYGGVLAWGLWQLLT